MKRLVLFMLCLLLFAAPAARAQSQSAAELYRIACKSVPGAWDDSEKQILADVFNAPATAPATKRLVGRSSAALSLFDAASKLPFGGWGYDPNEPMSVTRTLGGAEQLADLVVLRARFHAAVTGDRQSALNDSFNLLVLARRMSAEPSLARQKQQNALTYTAVQLAAQMMPDLPGEAISAFVSKFDQLRSAADPIEVARAESQAYLWYHQKLVSDPTFRRMMFRNEKVPGMLFGASWKPADVKDLFDDPEAAHLVSLEADRAFDDLIGALALPEPKRRAALAEELGRIQKSHPLVRGAGVVVMETYRLAQAQDAMIDLLRKGADIRSAYPGAIDVAAAQKIAAPYTFIAARGGFTLRATIEGEPQPLIVRFGSNTRIATSAAVGEK